MSFLRSQDPLDNRKIKIIPEKYLLLLHWLRECLWLHGSQQSGKFFKKWEYQTILFASWESCMHIKKHQLEPDIEQQTGPYWERSTKRLYIFTLLFNFFFLVQSSHSLWPHGLQHARLLCPSPTPRVYSNSCPSSWWCHPIISSSVIPFCFQSFAASGYFPMSQFFA